MVRRCGQVMARRFAEMLGGALLFLPAVASAQAYQCRIPQGPITLPDIPRDGPVRQTRVTGYTLALSWSPEFCRFREDSSRHARQSTGCGRRDRRAGNIRNGAPPAASRVPRGSTPRCACPPTPR
jgi:ribonuclease T2